MAALHPIDRSVIPRFVTSRRIQLSLASAYSTLVNPRNLEGLYYSPYLETFSDLVNFPFDGALVVSQEANIWLSKDRLNMYSLSPEAFEGLNDLPELSLEQECSDFELPGEQECSDFELPEELSPVAEVLAPLEDTGGGHGESYIFCIVILSVDRHQMHLGASGPGVNGDLLLASPVTGSQACPLNWISIPISRSQKLIKTVPSIISPERERNHEVG